MQIYSSYNLKASYYHKKAKQFLSTSAWNVAMSCRITHLFQTQLSIVSALPNHQLLQLILKSKQQCLVFSARQGTSFSKVLAVI